MGAEISTEQADEASTKTAQTALARRRGSALDHVHALLSAAIEAGTIRLDNIGKAVGHVNARITPLTGLHMDLDARQGRTEEHIEKLHARIDTLFEQLDAVDKKLTRLVEHAEETEKRRQRISAAMSGEKTTTLRRRAHNTPMPAEERYRALLAENGTQAPAQSPQ